MKKTVNIVLILVSAVLIYQFYQLYSDHRELSNTFSSVSEKLRSLQEESANLESDLKYFQEPENLVKELRSRFNYKKLGEKLIIIVPSKDKQTATSSNN